jgi:hypothetical protein
MEAANALLSNGDPDTLNIERLSEDQAQYIEMVCGANSVPCINPDVALSRILV